MSCLSVRARSFSATHRSRDRKSTRLNSSHGYISYAVFCLKKNTSELQSRLHLVCRLLLEKKSTRTDGHFAHQAGCPHHYKSVHSAVHVTLPRSHLLPWTTT